MKPDEEEETLLHSVALQNAKSILLARQRAEQELRMAKESLELRTEELARSLAMMHATLESTTDGILVTDGNGKVTVCNENYAGMWRIPREILDSSTAHGQLLEVTSRQFSDPGQFLARIEAIYASSQPDSFDLLELADGRVFERTSKIQFVEGRNLGRVWSFRDITGRRRSEEALRKQSELFRITLTSIGDGVITTDTAGRVSSMNPVAESLTGWPQQDAFGVPLDNVFQIVEEHHRRPVENPAKRALRDGKIVELANHTILIAKGGAEIAIDDSAAPIKDEDGNVIGVVLIFRDVSEKRKTEASLLRAARNARFLAEASAALAELADYESTLQKIAALAVPVFADGCAMDILQPDGTLRRLAIAHIDPARLRVAHDMHRRYPPSWSDLHGKMKVIRTGEPDWVAEVPDSLLASLARDEEHLGLLRELGIKSSICVPLAVRGKSLGAATFVRGEAHSFGPDDLVLAQDLARRVAIAMENARLYREVRAADRRKDEFLAMLGHELRNPLAPLRNALLLIRAGGLDDQTVELMERQVEQLVRLVDDLLDISRIMQGKIELRIEPVELSAIIGRARETAQPVIAKAGHELSVSLPPQPIWLDGDLVRLTQVITNLLNNAAKYSDPGSPIALTVEKEGDSGVALRVRDSGIGIDAELLPRIFDLFTQAKRSIDRSQGGLGIGLTLVRTLVELHGGTITAASAGRGKGSEFTVRLPTISNLPEAEPPEWIPAAVRKLRVLVVEDMVGSAQVLAKMLHKFWGHTVETTHDGITALEAAASFRPELVLLDLGLPGLSGYDVARNLRKQSEFDDTVLVALTGYGQESDRRRTAEAGFDLHLTKPPSVAMLEEVFRHPKLASPNA